MSVSSPKRLVGTVEASRPGDAAERLRRLWLQGELVRAVAVRGRASFPEQVGWGGCARGVRKRMSPSPRGKVTCAHRFVSGPRQGNESPAQVVTENVHE
jgi:hypothetical protein